MEAVFFAWNNGVFSVTAFGRDRWFVVQQPSARQGIMEELLLRVKAGQDGPDRYPADGQHRGLTAAQ